MEYTLSKNYAHKILHLAPATLPPPACPVQAWNLAVSMSPKSALRIDSTAEIFKNKLPAKIVEAKTTNQFKQQLNKQERNRIWAHNKVIKA